MKKILVFCFSILFLVQCAEKDTPPPKDILDEQTFTAVMIDVQLAEGRDTQKSYRRGEKADVVDLYPNIFERHKVDPKVFLKTYDYYTAHPGKMAKIYEQVLDSLSTLDVVIKREYNATERALNDSLRQTNQRKRDSLRVFQGLKKK